MALSDVPAGARVYIDANIFIAHFAAASEDCSAFLGRVEQGDVLGYIGQVGLLEVTHRLMMLEAVERGLAVRSNPAARLARQPDLARALSKYYFSALSIARMRVEILPLPDGFLTASQEFRQAHGLLANDSLVPMHMRHAGLSVLASTDQAFDRVPGIRRFGPSDI
jgi:predicted nucleic acid-binding protein